MKRHDLIRWEAPPPARPGPTGRQRRVDEQGGVWRDVAAALRDRPGEWAVIKECPTRDVSSLVAAIRFGHLTDFRPALDFEATSRTDGGRTVVYACYLPGDPE